MGTQHPLVVEFTLVIHVVLKLPQRLGRFQQLPVLVVWEMVLNEQCRMCEEVEFVVAGVEEELVRSQVGKQAQPPSNSAGVWGSGRGLWGPSFG